MKVWEVKEQSATSTSRAESIKPGSTACSGMPICKQSPEGIVDVRDQATLLMPPVKMILPLLGGKNSSHLIEPVEKSCHLD